MSSQPATTRALTVTVVTPEGELWSGGASTVTVPGAGGSLGIRPGRLPLASELTSGQVMIRTPTGESVSCTVTGGFVVVDEDEVTVIADKVEKVGAR